MISSPQKYAVDPFENHSDVGSVHFPGTCEYDPDERVYTMTSAGANVWHDHDDFHFAWRRMSGNFIVTTRAEFVGKAVNPHRNLGWMVRARLHTSSPNVSTGVHGAGLITSPFWWSHGGPT